MYIIKYLQARLVIQYSRFLLISLTPFLYSCQGGEVAIPNDICTGATIIESDVRGTSMEPIYHNGDIIHYSSGYYNCTDIQRDDIVIYHLANELLIKRIVAVPGDSWKYLSGNIIINGNILKNTEGLEYQIDSKMLELYAQSYPTLPNDTYMILGNQVTGTLDSSRFGLVSHQDIIGKVLSD